VLSLISLKLAKSKGTLSDSAFRMYLQKMQLIPSKIETLLKMDEKVKEIAAVYKDAKNCLYLGRGFNFPVALEGALKLKEISYIHAEGYPAAEM
jgi:glucosamine--fructose-6-phosphate aminotransferase (isomerizing)